MRTFVISLPESVDRRARIERQLLRQGIPFSFYDAINLNSDRNHYFHHCDEAQFQLNTGRTPTAGELGCFASHLMLWRTCRLLNEPILILEDDADLADDFAAAVPFVQRHIRRFGFIRLQRNDKRGKRCVVRQQQRGIDYCTRFPFGLAAYAIAPAVADVFIERSAVFRAPVDVFVKRYWRHGQPLFSLAPAVVELGPESSKSTIGGRQPVSQSASQVLRRWWHRRCDFVARAMFNLRWLRAEGKRTTLRMGRQMRLAGFGARQELPQDVAGRERDSQLQKR